MRFCGLTVPKEYSLDTIGFTQGLLKTYIKCQLKFLFCINRIYDPMAAQGRTTGFGSLFHHVLENTYIMYMGHRQFPSDEEITEWLNEYMTDHADELTGDKDLEMEATIIETMMPYYINFYRSDFKKIDIVEVELELAHKMHGYVWRGKVDLIFRMGRSLFTLDHKTHSRIMEASLVKTLSFDYQHLTYTVCTEDIMQENVEGSYHNVIRNPKYDFKGSFDECRRRLRQELGNRPAHFFKRFLVNFPRNEKQKHLEEAKYLIEEIQERLDGKRPFFHNPASCIDFGECPFLNACSADSLRGYKRGEVYFPELTFPLKEATDGKRSCKKCPQRNARRSAKSTGRVKNNRTSRVSRRSRT